MLRGTLIVIACGGSENKRMRYSLISTTTYQWIFCSFSSRKLEEINYIIEVFTLNYASSSYPPRLYCDPGLLQHWENPGKTLLWTGVVTLTRWYYVVAVLLCRCTQSAHARPRYPVDPGVNRRQLSRRFTRSNWTSCQTTVEWYYPNLLSGCCVYPVGSRCPTT